MNLVEMLKLHEGLELKPYLDTRGKMTIGYGRNLEDVGISVSEAETLLANDVTDAVKRCEQIFPWYANLDQVRRDVIVMLSFNMGPAKVAQFIQMIEAIKNGDYLKAAEEMLDSAWAKQVGNRALMLSKMMQLGKYPDA